MRGGHGRSGTDFVSDWVVGPNEKSVRIINIMDECSRKALWTEAHQSISAKKLIEVLDQVVAWRGTPAYIRCDNGPDGAGLPVYIELLTSMGQ
jgi:putative transposase